MRIVVILFFMICVCFVVYAGPVLYTPEQWSGGNLAGWTNALPAGEEKATLSNPGTGGAGPGTGYLNISFSPQGAPAVETDTIYADFGMYTGNYQHANLGINFSFWAEDTLPDTAILFFHSAVSADYWEYSFKGMLAETNVWSTISAPFDYNYGGWSGWSADPDDFLADLADIERIGITLSRDFTSTLQQDYGLDNWEYTVPEPGSMAVLFATFLSISFFHKKRLKKQG